MKLRVNQLDEEINEINSENKMLKVKNQELKKRNNLLVNKFGGSRNVNEMSVACQTEKVGITFLSIRSYLHIMQNII